MNERDRLARIVSEVAHWLPAQGPISVFVHHNPLHALEDQRFESAVVRAAEMLGCMPFLPIERYQKELARGRIDPRDVDRALDTELGDRADGSVAAGLATRRELARRIVLHGIPEAKGESLEWLCTETDVLTRCRGDLPVDAERALAGKALGDVYEACLRGIERASPAPPPSTKPLVRHAAIIHAATGVDVDDLVHPALIPFVAAYLDQGLARWPMPGRERGMLACFVGLFGSLAATPIRPWSGELRRLLAEEPVEDALVSIECSLEALGVSEEEQVEFLVETALALRGWAGMVRQLEERPDRVPARDLPVTLADFLAVRLLIERAVLSHVVRTELGLSGTLAWLRAHLQRRVPTAEPATHQERAWQLYHLAQLAGWDGGTLDRLDREDIDALEALLRDVDDLARRRILHLAYELHLRNRLYDALTQHRRPDGRDAPAFQAIFCIDEREESFRRHLEEVDPGVETLGAAGFFGVAMYYRGATDAHSRPLCPVAIQPTHCVAEVQEGRRASLARLQRHGAGLLGRTLDSGRHALFTGALLAALGAVAIVPLVLRVVFPWLGDRLRRLPAIAPRSRLVIERDADAAVGTLGGFTVEEMTDVVATQLENVGLVGRCAPLVLVVGHGSASLNNPHESAYDCGACGGGRGGPNARAFAQMANDPRVRDRLRARGVVIEPGTWFVGAERNTASNAVTFFDTERVPVELSERFERAEEAVALARMREAHERARRFESAPMWFPPLAALLHVESRAADLAQPRPECGHATNAFCVVGRRSATRDLFLDRRAFLVSYDPERDPDGRILARVLGAVVPVVAGISLEYWFGYVDPAGYGCGNKLPHNVTSLLGVMVGAQSDLRTGLPWQMVEIHEPVRLTLVVEQTPARVAALLAENPAIERLVRNRWLFLACLDPGSGELFEYGEAGFARYAPMRPLATVRGSSATHYRGERDHLDFVRIVTEGAAA